MHSDVVGLFTLFRKHLDEAKKAGFFLLNTWTNNFWHNQLNQIACDEIYPAQCTYTALAWNYLPIIHNKYQNA
ncbi:unnamed protein product, partial [Brenthis ino]